MVKKAEDIYQDALLLSDEEWEKLLGLGLYDEPRASVDDT